MSSRSCPVLYSVDGGHGGDQEGCARKRSPVTAKPTALLLALNSLPILPACTRPFLFLFLLYSRRLTDTPLFLAGRDEDRPTTTLRPPKYGESRHGLSHAHKRACSRACSHYHRTHYHSNISFSSISRTRRKREEAGRRRRRCRRFRPSLARTGCLSQR
jgi:hypothetical protein